MEVNEIKEIKLRKILDSRGNFSVECEVVGDSFFGRCSAPSGASVGKYEAVAYPKGVDDSIEFAKANLLPKLIGVDVTQQRKIDSIIREADGTDNFSKLGGNTAIAISTACAKASANFQGKQLFEILGDGRNFPLPLSKIIGGGKHAVNSCDIQEFLVVPVNAKKLYPALQANVAVHKKVKEKLKERGASLGRDDESGWVAKLKTEEALEILSEACESVSSEFGVEVAVGLDLAASSFFEDGKYVYEVDKRKLDRGEQIEFVLELIRKYKLVFVEDALHEEDFEGFAELTSKAKCIICGDDLFVTNRKRLERGVRMKACNALIIKPNQIGTLTQVEETVRYAKQNNYTCIASHRSGETCDSAISHVAVAHGCRMLKTNVIGGERNAKFNELIRIGERIGWVY
ncbi:MAG: enolase C-terminal domain-like protein [Candidatus Micrarchaeia archaeon]